MFLIFADDGRMVGGWLETRSHPHFSNNQSNGPNKAPNKSTHTHIQPSLESSASAAFTRPAARRRAAAATGRFRGGRRAARRRPARSGNPRRRSGTLGLGRRGQRLSTSLLTPPRPNRTPRHNRTYCISLKELLFFWLNLIVIWPCFLLGGDN